MSNNLDEPAELVGRSGGTCMLAGEVLVDFVISIAHDDCGTVVFVPTVGARTLVQIFVLSQRL